MRVKGLSFDHLQSISLSLDMALTNAREIGRFFSFRLVPKSSDTYYSRKTASGRRVKALCFHGWRDFIRVSFSRGATVITSTLGRWTSQEEFDADIPRIKALNIGSVQTPLTMLELCTHEGPLPPLLRRAVEVARTDQAHAV